MLKHAYQMGIQKALNDGNAAQLLKEAQEMGIDLEKLAFWGALGQGLLGAGKAGLGLGKTLGKGTYGALRSGVQSARGLSQQGTGTALRTGARDAGGGLRNMWSGMSSGQQAATAGLGGLAAGGAMFGGDNPGTSNSQFGY